MSAQAAKISPGGAELHGGVSLSEQGQKDLRNKLDASQKRVKVTYDRWCN
jgi:hypothetical protein